MFDSPSVTNKIVALADVNVLIPCEPSKMLALWNNYNILAAKLKLTPLPAPLDFVKVSTSVSGQGDTVHRPKSYAGPVVFEGELGIVIGQMTKPPTTSLVTLVSMI